MGKFKKLMEVSSNVGGYGADEGEPDTGFIRGDKKRVLGGLAQVNLNLGLKEVDTNRLTFQKLITFMVKVKMKIML